MQKKLSNPYYRTAMDLITPFFTILRHKTCHLTARELSFEI